MDDYSHILLSRTSTSDSATRFTLVARAGNLFKTIKLENTVLQTGPLPTGHCKNDAADILDGADGWLAMTRWDQFWQRLRLDGKNKCLDKWALRVPAGYIVDQVDDI